MMKTRLFCLILSVALMLSFCAFAEGVGDAAADEMVETFRQSSVLIHENPTRTEFYSPAK